MKYSEAMIVVAVTIAMYAVVLWSYYGTGLD